MEETIRILMRRIEELERKVTYLTTLENADIDPSSITPESIGALSLANGGTVEASVSIFRPLIVYGDNFEPKQILFRTGSNTRWSVGTDDVGETGSNAGSNFRVRRVSDTNVFDTVFTITRSTGYMYLLNRVYGAGLRTNPASPETSELYVDASGFVKRG